MVLETSNILTSLFSSGDITQTFLTALLDMVLFIGALVAVAAIAALLEHLFKNTLAGIIGQRNIGLIEAYLTFPGVVYHETSHALFALVLGAKVTKYSVFPQQVSPTELTLGSVEFIPRGPAPLRSLQIAMSAVAPAIMGLIGMCVLAFVVWPNLTEWWQYVLVVYAFICILLHSELSPQDIKSGVTGLPILAVALFVVFLFFPIGVDDMVNGVRSLVSGNETAAVTNQQPANTSSTPAGDNASSNELGPQPSENAAPQQQPQEQQQEPQQNPEGQQDKATQSQQQTEQQSQQSNWSGSFVNSGVKVGGGSN